MNTGNKVGEKIRYFRKKLNLTQEQLAKNSGLSRNAIYNYENGRRSPDIETLNKIAAALDTNVYNLIDNDTTLTSKLIKLFEKTICKNSRDAKNTLELICELVDIDEEVINKALENEEDISESYLTSMIDIIFKDSPGAFQKFYKENKKFIFSRYDIVTERCSELNIKYLNYLNYLTALNTESPSKHISNLYQKAKNNTLTGEDIKDIEDYKQLELMNNSDAFGGLQNYTDKDYAAFKTFKELLKQLDYSDDDVKNYSDDIFPKIKVQIEKEILYLKNKDTPQHE
ncbi:helix-turn-helix transcriptional regulator [Clostridium sp. WLY-B-L2]|jgi:transcriptional regulator with XRE-family HTH domain|uniref:Helix-turn-helix transcriptional regulator n=1 Tax=Clostridium aromativorans TaxID=2836848 RepID=A0ABS8N3K0_9CLOT|nr:helix-turn-helix transcriptional regulator [Clostridium aromativorans]MCC9294386.1 helix-turn-helix transcriptional regulator [Clostridium aromativorans]